MKNIKKLVTFIVIIFFLFQGTNILNAQYLNFSIDQDTTYDSNYNDKIQNIVDMITKDLLLEYMEKIVSFGPRPTDTYGCEKTAAYIADEFKKEGLQVQIQNWSKQRSFRPKILLNSQNIIGLQPGKNEKASTIIFNAHYDSVKQSPGADDDGSGVVAVMAAAYALSKFDFYHNIEFITFSGEEDGLLGSSSYAQQAYEQQKDILVELNADMIANANTDEGAKKLRVYGTEDVLWIVDLIDQMQQQYVPDFTLDKRTTDEEGRMASDYASFVYRGYEAIAFFESEWSLNFHSARDTIENIDIDYLVNNTKIIAATIARIADEQDIPPQIMIASPALGGLYFDGRRVKQIDELETTVINDIWIWAEVLHGSRPIERVDFYYNNRLVYTDYDYPYKWHFNKISLRSHRITAVVYDDLGQSSSDWRDIQFFNLLKNN
jgi:hypothetical protein